MTTEFFIKAIGDLGVVAVFLWLAIMFQRGEIVARVTLERIIEEVTSRTIAETSARIITAVNELMKEHNTTTHLEHQEISVKLAEHDVHATKVERDVGELQRRLQRADR